MLRPAVAGACEVVGYRDILISYINGHRFRQDFHSIVFGPYLSIELSDRFWHGGYSVRRSSIMNSIWIRHLHDAGCRQSYAQEPQVKRDDAR